MTNSDAVRLVADVLAEHHWDATPTFEGEYPVCSCNPHPSFRYRTDHDDHVAAAVVAALGGLTRELSWRVGGVTGLVLDSTDAEDAEVIARRWVSGWTPEETQ